MGAYDEDLAYIHHEGFGAFSRNAAPGILARLRAAGIHSGRIGDLGCGTGILARALGEAGYEVEGFDLSKAMLALARKHAPKARLRHGSFLDAELHELDAVTALGEIFNYVFDPRNEKKALPGLLRSIHRALRPGGLLMFDVAGPKRVLGRDALIHEGKDWSLFTERIHDAQRNRLVRKITAFRKRGQGYRRSYEEHALKLYRPGEVATLLRKAGFRVQHLRGYDARHPFPRGLAGFLARKA